MMSLSLLALGVALLTWPLLSYIKFPDLLSRTTHQNVITPQLSAFIQETLVLENITGLSVAIVPEYGESEFHTWGYRTEDQDEMTPDTMFHMASVSKAFCATALGLLIDDFANGNNVTALPSGVTELTWHTRLRDLLPEWGLMDEWASERANLRDILSHVSGLPRHDNMYRRADAPRAIIARLRYLQPAFELREQWSYNNLMYIVASHVIATYSGRSYTSFVEERIFGPLKMTSSTFSPTKAKASNGFTQGWTKDGRRVAEGFTEDVAFVVAGPGGIISNAVDMTKWVSMWIAEGVYDNQTIIPLSVYQNVSYSYSISTDHPDDLEPSIVGYGLGWFRNSYRGHDVVYHSGALPGLSTLVSFLPNDKIGVTVFANGENQAATVTSVSNRILDSALHLSSSLTPTSHPLTHMTNPEFNSTAQSCVLSLDALAGTYTNPGYGSLVLCSPTTASSYCSNVRSNFTIVDSVQGDPSPSGDLLAEWSGVFSSHVRLRAKQGCIFEFYFTSLYPNGYGKDSTPFETKAMNPTGLAEFVVEDDKVIGFGLSGLLGQLTERARLSETVQDRAEVWFDKDLKV